MYIAFVKDQLVQSPVGIVLPSVRSVNIHKQLPLWPGIEISAVEVDACPEGCELVPPVEARFLAPDDLAMYARARQLLYWQTQMRFCGFCGTENNLQTTPNEQFLLCPQCDQRHYPRLNPCIISILTDYDNQRVLLGQAKKHKNGMYACFAGFIEAGESAEQALVRELKEETGADIGRCRYLGSQSWPFPQQLMMAYAAEYRDSEIVADPDEMNHVKWFDIHALPDNIPGEQTIAGRIIRFVTSRMRAQQSLYDDYFSLS
ncbi:NAD(+) diphosphatase [Salinibius halmophilus]|uniref:NAD(+) diphosphatase n=1 Tax=Salinibius halmophilus TaxID=1853216 RepID=UPI000E6765D4|nr:NAD(+) diphosphatase [Salinibius halmophilus]